MSYPQTLGQHCHLGSIKYLAVIAVISIITSLAAAQATMPPQTETPWSQYQNKYPGLPAEFGQLLQKFQREVQFPPPRSQSLLLPLLPESTTFYAAFPNYGDASRQALTIFQQELQHSPVLRAWWQHGELGIDGPKVEDFLEKVYQLSQYLGDEIVVSAATEPLKNPSLLVVAEIRKPGLKDFLQQLAKDLAGKSPPAVRVFDVHELAIAKDNLPPQQLAILVRSDLVVAALNIAALRSFNAGLDNPTQEFPSTQFGQRLLQAYEGGTTVIGAADLQKILREVPPTSGPNQMIFQRTGFADMQYLVWERKNVAGQATSQMELSFTAPRHGVASWLAAPGPLGSLDFVSPGAIMAGATFLKNPAEIFDDVKDLSTASNPNAFAALDKMEAAWKLNLREDLFSQLGGELAFEVDGLIQPSPIWKLILQVNDPDHLQATLSTLLAATHFYTQEFEEDGITYHTLRIPSAQKPLEIAFAFVDGYLVIASSRETVADAIRLHRTGESLAKSSKFLASLPPGHLADVSGLLYEDPIAIAALSMRQASPEIAEAFSAARTDTTPAMVFAYGEESSIREVTTNAGVDAGVVLAVAAIAIPNLLRAQIAANESSAVGAIRIANTAQVTYSTLYPRIGYARDLATLGPGPSGTAPSAAYASLIDDTLGNAGCTAGAWCMKSGFRFTMAAVCREQRCDKFVVVGTPIAANTGTRSFCSTSDAVIRFKIGPPLTSPVTVSECQAWSPLQ